MSVIIEGLTLPKHNPKEIDKNVLIGYAIVKEDNTAELCLEGVHYLIKMLPTPHGRLIDADKAAHSILMMSSHPCGCSIENVKDVVEWLRFVNGDGNNFAFPTIIEAEVSE